MGECEGMLLDIVHKAVAFAGGGLERRGYDEERRRGEVWFHVGTV